MNPRHHAVLAAGIFATALLSLEPPSSLAATHSVPDEFPTIQAAIEAAAPGDRILVAPGTYRGPLALKPGVALVSRGDPAGTDSPPDPLARAEVTILDGGGGEAQDGAGIAMAEASEIDGFTITGFGRFDEAGWEEAFANQGAHQEHDQIGLTPVAGILADDVGCRIANNIVENNGGAGIAIHSESAGRFVRIEGNRCRRNMGAGIAISGPIDGLVARNHCAANFFAGIGHSHGARPLVADNECTGNVRAGIGISEGASPVVRGNRCWENRRAGIGIRTGATTRPLVEDNECFGNAMAGIGCEEDAQPVIRNNRCHHNTLAGIGTTDAARPIIVGNTIEENEAAGIAVSGAAAAIVAANTCRDNKLVALGIPDNSRALVAGNTFSRTGGGAPPLVALRQGSRAILVENSLEGGGVATLLVEGHALAQANTFANPPENGAQRAVWVWKESTLTAVSNRFDGFAKTIDADPNAMVLDQANSSARDE